MNENKSSVGSIIATIIIIALVILGGLYFWGKRMEENKKILNNADITEEEVYPGANEAAAISSTSASDEIKAIEKDLQETNTTDLSTEFDIELE